jgi:hypothetical protein
MKKTETKKTATPKAEKNWEIKERVYRLIDISPLVYVLKNTNVRWFDEEAGYEREVKATANQRTVFIDEFQGQVVLEHVIFRDGLLVVPPNKVILQKYLSLYHPFKGSVYTEVDEEVIAKDELADIELEIKALNAARDLDIDHAEAILRVEHGSSVSDLSSKEIKRDLLIMAKKNPKLFVELVQDENVELRNLGIKATEAGIIRLSQDNRTFTWGETKRKLMTVPFDEHPYSALAAFFKTDEGLEIFNTLQKRLK